MGLAQAILLGCVQGLTEFLPVSSSAHLVAAQSLLGISAPGISVEVAAHVGTLLAILAVFLRPLAKVAGDGVKGAAMYLRGKETRTVRADAPLFFTAVAIVIGSVPAVLAGVLFEQGVERVFSSLTASGALLCVTGLVLLASRWAPVPKADEVGPVRGFFVGLAQACALLPGISRSGATIVTGCFLGVERAAAARFSFMLAAPAIAGAALWKLGEGLSRTGAATDVPAGPGPAALAATATVSAVVGAACLLLLLRIVQRGRLHWFAAYCLPAGAAMAVIGLWVQ